MERTKNGTAVSKALMVGTALVSLNALAIGQAQAVTGTGAMSAVILTPIVVGNPTTLHFGSMTETAGGTMLVDTAGARTPGGTVVAVGGLGLESQGGISIAGATGVAIDFSVTAGPFTVSDGGGNTMAVGVFDLDTGAPVTNAITVTLTAATQTFPVGATLTVGAAQTPGTYTGAYTVDASYQ